MSDLAAVGARPTTWRDYLEMTKPRVVAMMLLCSLVGTPYVPITFRTPLPYRYVRHPLYVGFLLAFWMTPTMTLAHLVFAVATTAYIVLAIQFEERDLVHQHGATYEHYRRRVPMLLPGRPRRSVASAAERPSTLIESPDV